MTFIRKRDLTKLCCVQLRPLRAPSSLFLDDHQLRNNDTTPTTTGEQIFARAQDSNHQKKLSSITDVVAMVPTLPEDSIIVSLPFGGAVLRSLGLTAEEVNLLLEDTRKKFVMEKGEFFLLLSLSLVVLMATDWLLVCGEHGRIFVVRVW